MLLGSVARDRPPQAPRHPRGGMWSSSRAAPRTHMIDVAPHTGSARRNCCSTLSSNSFGHCFFRVSSNISDCHNGGRSCYWYAFARSLPRRPLLLNLSLVESPDFESRKANAGPDYSLSNPDTLTKYKQAAQISQKVLEAVSGTARPSKLISGRGTRSNPQDRMVHRGSLDHRAL